jgi:osmotically-inducible protein OsmY
MAVASALRSDTEVQRDVLDELKWEPRVSPNEIGVVVKDAVVTLTGWVDSYSKRWAAEEAARRVRGVKAVANDIEVRLSKDDQRTDGDIAAAVVRALEWDAFVPAGQVTATVSNGWVTLRGEVDWQYQRDDAERVTRRIVGVKGVGNLITIKARPSPAELKKKIEDAIVRTAEVDAKNIAVEVEGSKVILKGTVRSWAEKDEAARSTIGSRSGSNQRERPMLVARAVNGPGLLMRALLAASVWCRRDRVAESAAAWPDEAVRRVCAQRRRAGPDACLAGERR